MAEKISLIEIVSNPPFDKINPRTKHVGWYEDDPDQREHIYVISIQEKDNVLDTYIETQKPEHLLEGLNKIQATFNIDPSGVARFKNLIFTYTSGQEAMFSLDNTKKDPMQLFFSVPVIDNAGERNGMTLQAAFRIKGEDNEYSFEPVPPYDSWPMRTRDVPVEKILADAQKIAPQALELLNYGLKKIAEKQDPK